MISFIIPAHNEERLIGRNLNTLEDAARAVGHSFEVVVVDDVSNDHTAAIAHAHGARVIAVSHRRIAPARNADRAAQISPRGGTAPMQGRDEMVRAT